MKMLFVDARGAGARLATGLKGDRYFDFRFAVAYARASGVRLLRRPLSDFLAKAGFAQGIIGVNQGNTSYQALLELHSMIGNNLHVRFGRSFSPSFHPKLYIFGKHPGVLAPASVIAGSFNMTLGGLRENEECGGFFELDGADCGFAGQVADFWLNSMTSGGNFSVLRATPELLSDLLERGALIDERKKQERSAANPSKIAQITKQIVGSLTPRFSYFVMTLSHFDVSTRSADPVILIPIRARAQDSNFWFWPHFFIKRERALDSVNLMARVTVDDASAQENIRIYDYPNRTEFRLKSEKIKRSGSAGDILLVQRTDGSMNIVLIRANSGMYPFYASKLRHSVSAQKRYGYFNV